eukprot:1483226-Rhodomonas_salina.4
MSGTDLAYAATSCGNPLLRSPNGRKAAKRMLLRLYYAICGTDIAYAPTSAVSTPARMVLPDFRTTIPAETLVRSLSPYAMPGTRIAYGARLLRACYGMCGTELAYTLHYRGTERGYTVYDRGTKFAYTA